MTTFYHRPMSCMSSLGAINFRPVTIDGDGFASLNGLHIALTIVEKVLYMDRLEFRFWLKIRAMRQRIIRENIRATNRS